METFEYKVMVTYKEKVGAYQRVFSGEDGKIVLDDLMNFCGVDRPSFDVNNVNATFLNEGTRAVGLRIQYYKNDEGVTNEWE
jgi:hypothetical protein